MLICMQVFQDALKQYARRKDKNLIRNLSKKRSADVSRHIIMEFYKDFTGGIHQYGSIIASVTCREYAMTHPFVGYSAYDGVEHCVYYYTRDTHKKFEWPDKTMNADRLVSALQVLKK